MKFPLLSVLAVLVLIALPDVSFGEGRTGVRRGGRQRSLEEGPPSSSTGSSDSDSDSDSTSGSTSTSDSTSVSDDEEEESSGSDDGKSPSVATTGPGGVIGQSNPPSDYSIPPPMAWTDDNQKTAEALLDQIDEWVMNATSIEGQLLVGAVTSVCNYNLVPPQWTYENKEGKDVVRCSFWKDYRTNGKKTIRSFFEDWLYYTPIPAATSRADGGRQEYEGFSAPKFQRTISGPGYYIERYDFIANTLPGRTLNFATPTFGTWMKNFLDIHGTYLSTPASIAPYETENPEGDVTPAAIWSDYQSVTPHPYNISEYIVPPKTTEYPQGFSDYTSIFLRNIPKDLRPVTCRGTCQTGADKNLNYISSPCDAGVAMLSYGAVLGTKGPWTTPNVYGEGGVLSNQEVVGIDSIYNIPGKLGDTFGIMEAFGGYGSAFLGGPVIDLLLWFTDFHHFFAPVDGTVVYSNDFMGSHQYDFDNFDPNFPFAPKPVGSSNQVEWYSNMDKHRRWAIVFEATSADIGLVGMAPVGFWGVGSMTVYSEVGDTVKRGDYVGHFLYGGSSILLTFEPGKNFNWVEPQPKKTRSPPLMINNIQFPHQVNARAAIGEAIPLTKAETAAGY